MREPITETFGAQVTAYENLLRTNVNHILLKLLH